MVQKLFLILSKNKFETASRVYCNLQRCFSAGKINNLQYFSRFVKRKKLQFRRRSKKSFVIPVNLMLQSVNCNFFAVCRIINENFVGKVTKK